MQAKIEAIIAQSKAPDWRKRKSAIEALDYISENPAVILPLVAALDDPHFSVRHAAAQALGHAADTRAVPKLIDTLHDENFMVRAAAAAALGQIRDERACPALAAALNDKDFHVRHHAAEGLANIGMAALEVLIERINHPDEQCHRHACEALSKIGDRLAVPPLMALITHPDANRRINAIRALGKLRAYEATEAIIAALDDPDPQVVIDAGYALAAIGDERAIEPLSLRLDNEKLIRRLADFGEAALPALLKALEAPHSTPHLIGVIVALEAVKHRAALWPLIPFLQDAEVAVRWATVNALAWLGEPEAAPFLAPLLDDDSRINGRPLYVDVVKALQKIDTPQARRLIEDWEQRQQ